MSVGSDSWPRKENMVNMTITKNSRNNDEDDIDVTVFIETMMMTVIRKFMTMIIIIIITISFLLYLTAYDSFDIEKEVERGRERGKWCVRSFTCLEAHTRAFRNNTRK